MKQESELHPAQRAITTKEYDALWPKPALQKGIRPLTPMVECRECEKLRAENEALREENKALIEQLEIVMELLDKRTQELYEALQ